MLYPPAAAAKSERLKKYGAAHAYHTPPSHSTYERATHTHGRPCTHFRAPSRPGVYLTRHETITGRSQEAIPTRAGTAHGQKAQPQNRHSACTAPPAVRHPLTHAHAPQPAGGAPPDYTRPRIALLPVPPPPAARVQHLPRIPRTTTGLQIRRGSRPTRRSASAPGPHPTPRSRPRTHRAADTFFLPLLGPGQRRCACNSHHATPIRGALRRRRASQMCPTLTVRRPVGMCAGGAVRTMAAQGGGGDRQAAMSVQQTSGWAKGGNCAARQQSPESTGPTNAANLTLSARLDGCRRAAATHMHGVEASARSQRCGCVRGVWVWERGRAYRREWAEGRMDERTGVAATSRRPRPVDDARRPSARIARLAADTAERNAAKPSHTPRPHVRRALTARPPSRSQPRTHTAATDFPRPAGSRAPGPLQRAADALQQHCSGRSSIRSCVEWKEGHDGINHAQNCLPGQKPARALPKPG
ncbi:hypothetical protein HYPSUDRAFT_200327 [Hypholoma sublateritium FD-334 SS-4]|uniref:Uncharacterized protein n=1 Tax=Hypholoma sublateritium (strain FD-334 SS-4) TaxID=945553 RepID=A0A0D2LC28_HYPSF|nr:hypothetical protein HYPSUDRAFT_200327 [Hypholoma sublateritium FD-334 SS-4]